MTVKAPDYATAVVGYRWWVVRAERLWSPNVHPRRPHAWQPGVNHARCNYESRPPEHEPVHEFCECGLYAWGRPDLCEPDSTAEPVILGLVALWGRMYVASEAVRAEFAQVLALASPSSEPVIEAVADSYGVPLLDDLSPERFDNATSIGELYDALNDKAPA